MAGESSNCLLSGGQHAKPVWVPEWSRSVMGASYLKLAFGTKQKHTLRGMAASGAQYL